jgi:Zn-dependent peptidase ImmA (M78 family)
VPLATNLDDEFCERAELLALRWRAKLGLSERERLDPYELVEEMEEVAVMRMADVRGFSADHLAELHAPDSRALSAITVVRGERKLIVINESHTTERQINSLTHELAHLLLAHPPSSAFDALGNRLFPKLMEDEADWLAACLLVPADAIEVSLREHGSQHAAAAHFGVSIELMRWRCNSYGHGERVA